MLYFEDSTGGGKKRQIHVTFYFHTSIEIHNVFDVYDVFKKKKESRLV